MKRYTIFLLLFTSVVVLHAQQKAAPVVYVGYLVDHMCGKQMAKLTPEKADAKAAKHTKECALDENCKVSGYGIVSKGLYLKLDAAGDQLAETFLKKTTKENHNKVEIRGTVDGGLLKVVSLKDGERQKKFIGKS